MTNEKELIYVSGQIRKIMSEQGLTHAKEEDQASEIPK